MAGGRAPGRVDVDESGSCLRRYRRWCAGTARRRQDAPDRGVRSCACRRPAPPRPRRRARGVTRVPNTRRSTPTLHPTIVLLAGAHMMVDGYGNIYAPLLPLLIPRLGL